MVAIIWRKALTQEAAKRKVTTHDRAQRALYQDAPPTRLDELPAQGQDAHEARWRCGLMYAACIGRSPLQIVDWAFAVVAPMVFVLRFAPLCRVRDEMEGITLFSA